MSTSILIKWSEFSNWDHKGLLKEMIDFVFLERCWHYKQSQRKLQSKSSLYEQGIFSSFLWPNVIIQIHCKLRFSGIVCRKKENILYPSLHSRSGQIGGSAKDLLRDVDSWAHSAGRWVSDTRMRLWNRTRVIPGHLHTASVPYRHQPPSISSSTSFRHSFLVCPSICLVFLSHSKSLHLF